MMTSAFDVCASSSAAEKSALPSGNYHAVYSVVGGKMSEMNRRGLLNGAGARLGSRATRAATPIRIDVISDQSGPYRGTGGPGSVAGARLAVSDFGGTVLGRPIEVLVGDHQNKPDIGVAIVRKWLDADGVHAITDGGSSAVGVAIQQLTRDRDRLFMITGSTSTVFTGADCSPTGFHWMTDTYSTASAAVSAELANGRRSDPEPVSDLLGLSPGADITVTPDDTGRDPVAGRLLAAGAHEIILRRQAPGLGALNLHVPRAGFDAALA